MGFVAARVFFLLAICSRNSCAIWVVPRVAPSALNAASSEASSSAASFFSFVERLPSVPHVVVPASDDTSPVDICGPPWSPKTSCNLAATPSNADVTGFPCVVD